MSIFNFRLAKIRRKMSRLDYSKWDHIEISDDEDDTHPNVDTASLHKWRHEARLERMKQDEIEKQKFQDGYQDHHRKMNEIKQKLKESEKTPAAAKETNVTEDISKLKLEMSELEKQENEWKVKEEELKKKEKLTPLNIDTICHDVKSKTIINKPKPRKKENLTDEERAERQKQYEQKYKKKLKEFGMLRKYDDSSQFLQDNAELAVEETANFLVIWCIDLEVEEKHELMAHVAHQTIVMQFILELAKSLDMDPRGCVRAFFSRVKLGEKQYMDAFNDELDSFKERIRDRAKARVERYMAEYEEEERKKRLGPGGLDPVEVFESLPENLQKCFDSRDIELLKETIANLSEEDARYHLKRCVDSGLWVPEGNENAEDGATGGDDPDYETPPETPPRQ